jgi:5-methylthioadenosine/S-adenosylhomocysteine deaminase
MKANGPASIAINGGLVVTQSAGRTVFRGGILIEDGKIAAVGKGPFRAEHIIDAKGCVSIPGLINTHTHVAMASVKGRFDDMNLEKFLESTSDYDAGRSKSDIYESAKLGMREMISSGTSSFLDLYYSEDIIARAAESVGIRAFLSWNTLDPKYTTQRGDPLKNAERFIRSHMNLDMVTPAIGVQGVYVAGDETYLAAKEISEKYNTLLHTHLAESAAEVSNFKREYGHGPIEHLHRIGFLGRNLVAAHLVYASKKDIGIIASDGVSVSWNAISNAKLGNGFADIAGFVGGGINLTLGTDGSSSNNSLDLFQSMKFSGLLAKGLTKDPTFMSAQALLDAATVNAASALGRSDIGKIEKGCRADVVLLDATMPNMVPTTADNVVGNLVYSAGAQNVKTVIVGGRIVKGGS